MRMRGRGVPWRVLSVAVCLVVGLLVVISAINARGTDLRPSRNTDLVSLVEAQSQRNADLTDELISLRDEVDELSVAEGEGTDLSGEVAAGAARAGLTPVAGPAVTVTLDDAPDTVAGDDIDDDLLVVHQQDIQAVVNALWRGGAEAMTIQGQRVISTTGVKCVGNTVVLHGIPYAPPYEVSAVGDIARLQAELASSPYLQIYQQYVDAYGLVYAERTEPRRELPGFEGTIDLTYARPR